VAIWNSAGAELIADAYTWNAVIAKTEVSIMSAAGADVLMGALLTWNGQIVTHWFRKRLNE